MKRLNHLRRLVGTALSFAIFGIAGLVTGLAVFPLMFVFISDRDQRKVTARRTVGALFRLFVRLMRFFGVMDHDISGHEHLQGSENLLIIANHPTLIDVVILLSLFPQANCVVKSAVTRNPFMRGVAGAADYISNSEPEELLEACSDCLKSGSSLLLFPEGTRTTPGQPVAFKAGASTVAARSGVDILPIVIHCDPAFLHKDVPWHYVPEHCPMYTIRVLPAVSIGALVPGVRAEREVRQQLNRELEKIIQEELDIMVAGHAK